MSTSTHRLEDDLGRFGKAYWLPATGWGNGLEDAAWAAILDVTSERAATLVTQELKRCAVPAHAAPVTRFGGPSHRARADCHRYRIWVGSGSYGQAETSILHYLPELMHSLDTPVIAP